MAKASGGSSRKHVLIFSRTCLFLNSEEKQKELNAELDVFVSRSDEFSLYFTSHAPSEEMFASIPKGMGFIRRGDELRAFIHQSWNDGNVVIICGAVDKDLEVAAQTKSFLIAAGWVTLEEKVIKYGVPAPTPRKMRALIEIVVNQSSWYYSCTFNDPVPTKVVSLCLANTYSRSVSPDEKAMAEAFQAILKDGCNVPVIKQALLCHLMAAIAHDNDFREVQDWAVAPSSGLQPSVIMEELKEHVRYMQNGRKPQQIFIRHTQTKKSRFDPRAERESNNYCQKHFRSIHVNDDKTYKGKLKGRVVCVFDDYLTNGSTFEALRNLLVACKVKKIILVSIGKFKRNDEIFYGQKSFSIRGDVHSANYTATFESATEHAVNIDDDAKRSLGDLRELASHLR